MTLVRKPRAALAGVVLAFALAGYGQLLLPNRVVASPYSDLFAYHFAAKAELRHALVAGDSLTWREDRLAGQPGLTHPQASWGNPLHALFWLLPPERAVGPTLFALLVAAAFGCAALAGALGLGYPARAFAALAGLFQAKFILVAYAGWLGVWPSLALLPWLFWALVLALDRPGLPATLRLGLVGALLLHCGQLQIPYHGGLAAGAWAVVRLVATRGRDARRILPTLALAFVFAFAAAAWLLGPLAAEAPLLTRAHADWRFFLSGHALSLRHLLTFVRPEILGTPYDRSYPAWTLWEDEAYFGVVPLVAAIVALVTATRRRPWVRLLAASFALTLMMTFDSPLLRLAYVALPGFRLFRCPSRLLFLTSLFGILLGAFGCEAILQRLESRRLRASALMLMIVIIGAEGIYFAHRYLPTEPIASALPPSPVAERILAEPGRFRVALVGFPEQMTWPVRPAPLMQVGGYDSYGFVHYRDYFERMRTGAPTITSAQSWLELDRVTRWELLDALAVRFVLAPASLALPADRFDVVGTFDHEPVFLLFDGIAHARVRLWRNRNAAPFAEVWHPGWRATVDGAPAAIERSDGALVHVVVPPGEHDVRLRFVPLGWPTAPIVSLLAALLWICGLGSVIHRSSRSRTSSNAKQSPSAAGQRVDH
ncbi:MAG TPA: hypothetical protein VIA18_00330 [Polyangia bacterium]|nr:hypothetical protein [Polyangia bacterium]